MRLLWFHMKFLPFAIFFLNIVVYHHLRSGQVHCFHPPQRNQSLRTQTDWVRTVWSAAEMPVCDMLWKKPIYPSCSPVTSGRLKRSVVREKRKRPHPRFYNKHNIYSSDHLMLCVLQCTFVRCKNRSEMWCLYFDMSTSNAADQTHGLCCA